MNKKKIVFGAAFYWQSFLHIGSHQYAKAFARNDYRVAYISEPISPMHLAFAKDRGVLREKFCSWNKGGEWVEEGKIWAYVPLTFLPVHNRPFLRSRFTLNNSHRFTLPSIGNVLRRNEFDQSDIVFLDEAYDYLLDMVNHKKSIFRLHDDIGYLHKKGYENFLEKEKEVIQEVDLVVAVSKRLEMTARELGAKKVLYLPNGADFEFFCSSSDTLPGEYKSIPRPRIIYAGSINYWFDVDLVAYVASRLPKVSFIFVGKPTIDISKIAELSNVYLLGKRDHTTLASYLKNADVGLLPYNPTLSRIIFAHPIKLYEYMACGLPVVSMKWEEVESINSPARLASDYEEFVQQIREALDEKDRSKYLEFAKANSWDERFKSLMAELQLNVSTHT